MDDEYDSGEDLFVMQGTFLSEEDVNTQGAIDAVNSLLSLGENDIPGEPVELLDFSNSKDNFSFISDHQDDMTDFLEVFIFYVK